LSAACETPLQADQAHDLAEAHGNDTRCNARSAGGRFRFAHHQCPDELDECHDSIQAAKRANDNEEEDLHRKTTSFFCDSEAGFR